MTRQAINRYPKYEAKSVRLGTVGKDMLLLCPQDSSLLGHDPTDPALTFILQMTLQMMQGTMQWGFRAGKD